MSETEEENKVMNVSLIRDFINANATGNKKRALLTSIDTIERSGIIIRYNMKRDGLNIELYDRSKGEDVGHFEINKISIARDMGIGLEWEEFDKGKGYARLMMAVAIYIIYDNIRIGKSKSTRRSSALERSRSREKNSLSLFTKDTLLSIDTDASAGFWDKIGMRENRHYDSSRGRDIQSRGHEKIITLRDLSNWTIGNTLFTDEGIGRGITVKNKNRNKNRNKSIRRRRKKTTR